jgi:hypothetical protein
MIHKFLVTFAVTVLFHRFALAADGQIEIQVQASSVTRLGDDLAVSVELVNVSDDVVVLPRTYRHNDLAPAQVRVTIGVNTPCATTLVDFRNGKSSSPEHRVSLFPGERLTLPTQTLNVNILGQEIWAEATKTTLRVEYATDLADSRFNGVVSRDVTVEFVQPPMDDVRQQRDALRNCIQSGGWGCERFVGYFAAVQDEEAADLLLGLLGKYPHMFYVARAIANQGRLSDARALDTVSTEPGAYARFLESMAIRIRDRHMHGCDTQASDKLPAHK